jgi:hypothetical protein
MQNLVWRTMQYTTRVNAVLHYGLMRVNAVRTGSIRISIWNRNPCKNFEHDQNFFSALSYSRNPSGIDNGLRCESTCIRVEPGRYEFNSVWTRFEIQQCVIAFPKCRPHSKLFWPVSTNVKQHLQCNSWLTRTDPCLPVAANIKEKLVKLGQTRVDPFRTAATPTDPYLPFSYSGDQLLNPYTKTVSSRFYPDRMQINIYMYSGTFSPATNPVRDPAVCDCSIRTKILYFSWFVYALYILWRLSIL